MKRLLAIGLLVLLLGGCHGRAPTATDLLAKLLTGADVPSVEIYFDGAMPEETGYLSEEESALLYNGHLPSKLSDEYAVALCKDDRIYEIHLYHALDTDKAEAIESHLRQRQTLLAGRENLFYDPDSSAAGSVIWRKGKWVCLLVTDDNERAREILRGAL
ncbi:MAG: hypothetical protein IJX47_02495 [Clostridia bacterium]|nr:hypothetical protein [Clostridia bacterium]